MDIIYGCECPCNNHINGADKTPVAFIIERNGKEMKVCTRCDLTSDKKIARLFDRDTLMQPFMEFDALGAVCLGIFLDDKEWEDRKAKSNTNN